MFSVVLYASNMVGSINQSAGHSGSYAEISFSYLGLLLRVVLFYIIYKLYKPGGDKKADVMFDVYHCGFLVYIALFLSSLISQRITLPLKSVEILLIPILLYSNPVCIMRRIKSLKYEYTGFAISIIIIMSPGPAVPAPSCWWTVRSWTRWRRRSRPSSRRTAMR